MFAAAVLVTAMLTPAFAQDYGRQYARDYRDWNASGRSYVERAAQRWHQFLDQDENRNFAERFHANPNIIHDEREMEQDSGVRELFNRHPEVRDYVNERVRDYNRDTRPAEKWDRLMAANPNFAERYRRDHSIINDSNLDNDEPAIAQFLRTNPDVRDYFRSYASRGNGYGRDEDSDRESFRNNHPGLVRKLRENPSLINDDDFVRNHPDLREYLRDHPDARF